MRAGVQRLSGGRGGRRRQWRSALEVRLARAVILVSTLSLTGAAPVPVSAAGREDLHALPAAAARSAQLRARLETALVARGGDYVPRTEHLLPDGGPRYVNRLLLEDSPYLHQHAHNPVDWYPWGEEAFARARREGKPIFLSIGYSTCHWCHVMERESFDNAETAEVLNRNFVCIKVDREQRPDVDSLYMTAVQLLIRRGGWPLSNFLTPDGKPFFGGTYFPPDVFRRLLEDVGAAWETRRDEVLASADRLSKRVELVMTARGAARSIGDEAVGRAVADLLQRFDSELGGFGEAPKFPHESELLFLEHVFASAETTAAPPSAGTARRGSADLLQAIDVSLQAMARGGLHDQIGGGFHRYSTDARWLVPHFEKMLYNQAQLVRAYVGAFRLTADRLHRRVARQALDYVLAEMTSPSGLFYSATDADSLGPHGEDEEGAFFVWTPSEIRAALDPADADLALDLYGVSGQGNFEGRNVLHLPLSLRDFAARRGLSLDQLLLRVDGIRSRLVLARARRPPPLRDDKVIVAWNGMMLTALAEAAEVLGEDRYRAAAVRAAETLWLRGRSEDGRLWRVLLAGRASVPGLLEDYAHFAQGLLAVYDLTGEPKWLQRAREIADSMEGRFWDDEDGGFFMSPKAEEGEDGEDGDSLLLTRPKGATDGAVPSGNAVAVRMLARLEARTGEPRYRSLAERTVAALSATIDRYPAGFSYVLLGLDELRRGEVGGREWAAGGVVRVTAALSPRLGTAERELEVTLAIRDGWHVNSRQPLADDLVATEVAIPAGIDGLTLSSLRYPDGRRVYLASQGGEAAIYEGTPTITGRLLSEREPTEPMPLVVRLQACDDSVCLAPETVRLELLAGEH